MRASLRERGVPRSERIRRRTNAFDGLHCLNEGAEDWKARPEDGEQDHRDDEAGCEKSMVSVFS